LLKVLFILMRAHAKIKDNVLKILAIVLKGILVMIVNFKDLIL